MAEILAGEDIGDMHFDDRGSARSNSVGNGNRGVSIATSVEDYAVAAVRLLNEVDKFALDIRLAIRYLGKRSIFGNQRVDECGHTGMPIERGLALANEIQVWSVDYDYFLHNG